MNLNHQAEEHLRTIRTMMERATTYRALSAPTALFGAALSLALAAYAIFSGWYQSASPSDFLYSWLGVLLLTTLFNVYFVWKIERNETSLFLSPRLRTALLSILPAALSAGVFTFFPYTELRVSAWILFYGLMLLSMQSFAPKSLSALGCAFLVAGLFLFFFKAGNPAAFQPFGERFTWFAMGGTFGLFHLIYGGYEIAKARIHSQTGDE